MGRLDHFEGLCADLQYRQRLQETYPDLDILAQFRKMRAWLEANPRHRYKNYKRFMVNWLNKEDRHASRANRQEVKKKYGHLAQRDIKRSSEKDSA